MSMDFDEIKDWFESLMEKQTEITEKSFEAITIKLDYIKDLSVRTKDRIVSLENRVYQLEAKENSHFINCPNVPVIRELGKSVSEIHDTLISKMSVKKWLISSIAVASAIIGIILSILKYLKEI